MPQRVNQLKAAISLSKYSLLATLKSPTSVVFSLLFPVIFIVVFGTMVNNRVPDMKLAVSAISDTSNAAFIAIHKIPNLKLQIEPSAAAQTEDLKKGRIAGVITIIKENIASPIPHYTVQLQQAGAAENANLVPVLLNEALSELNQKAFPANPTIAALTVSQLPGRTYRAIDFILPGQLGFSLLMAGVYGSSFLLFNLRQTLVLKRLRVAPVKRRTIIAGEMLSRLFFHIISFIIMVALGYYVFNFTLVNGAVTFIEMLVFSLFGLFIFMGIGFIISGLVQNENSITPIANTIVLPQILLCGLFFPVENYPHWLQQFCNVLPLTLFVEGLRKIAFEDIHIWQMPTIVAGLLIWTFIFGPLSIRTFRWE